VEARRIFRRLAPLLVRLRLLTSIDHESFALMCLHGGIARKAALEMFGALTVEDERHLQRKNPLNQLLREHSEAYARYAARFGLSPADRAELDIPEAKKTLREQLEDDRFFGNPWEVLK
jgi:P27 family predicted phage terminase small subunit